MYSKNQRREERRREDNVRYERECEERNAREAEFKRKYGPLLIRLEELGIDTYLLSEYIKEISND